MENITEWINTNGKDILACIGAIITIASFVVKITPTQKDDAFLTKLVALLDYFSIVNPNGTETKKVEVKKDGENK